MAKTHRRYQEVAARISRYVAEHGLLPGSRLPGEIDLAKVCGVSRPTIREAMVALEIAGELEIRSAGARFRPRSI
jgi:GntR family transcriptional repressor for pyruvate dehydrogenase complex